jgi:hypothetical protein
MKKSMEEIVAELEEQEFVIDKELFAFLNRSLNEHGYISRITKMEGHRLTLIVEKDRHDA